MDEVEAGDQLRRELLGFRKDRPFGRYPSALQARAVKFASERRQAGVSVSKIASELGVRPITARAWCRQSGDEGGGSPSNEGVSLVPLMVCADAATTLEVRFPDGTRCQASGVTGPVFAHVIEALRRPR
jgi:transposase-like protein